MATTGTRTRRPATRMNLRWTPELRWHLQVDEAVAGTVRIDPVMVRVGNGQHVHHGTQMVAIVTVPFEHINRFGNVDHTYAAGEEIAFEPDAACATTSTYKTNGYANGWRGKNSIVKGAEVTCSRCKR